MKKELVPVCSPCLQAHPITVFGKRLSLYAQRNLLFSRFFWPISPQFFLFPRMKRRFVKISCHCTYFHFFLFTWLLDKTDCFLSIGLLLLYCIQTAIIFLYGYTLYMLYTVALLTERSLTNDERRLFP